MTSDLNHRIATPDTVDPLFGNINERTPDEQEQLATTGKIERLMEARDPPAMRAALKELNAEKSDEWTLPILDLLASDSGTRGGDVLAQVLLANGYHIRLVREGAFRNLEHALQVLRRVSKVSPALNVDLLQAVWNKRKMATTRLAALRVLIVIENLEALSRTLPILVQVALYCDDKVIRSKATLLAARAQADGRLVLARMGDPDHRVRSNAVEALWGLRTATAIQIFRQLANSPREHHRVVANAAVGLYLAGDQVGAGKRLKQMAASESADTQAASAWAMAYLRNRGFLPDLAHLSRSPHKRPARAAENAIGRIESAGSNLQSAQ